MSRTSLADLPFPKKYLFQSRSAHVTSLQRQYMSSKHKNSEHQAPQLKTKRPFKTPPRTDWSVEEQNRIHISGLGAAAKFLICALAQGSVTERPLKTLLVQESVVFHRIAERNRKILFADGAFSSIVDGFDVELFPLSREAGERVGRG